jgi:ketosteroid isomerase-like protein
MGRPGKILPRAVHRKVKSPTMARSSLEAFSALWRAYGEGRLGESLHLVHPECELSLLDGVGPVRGHDGVRDCLAAAQREWKTLRIVYDDLFEDHPGCVVGSGRLAASRTDGARVDRPLAFVAEFRAARLVRARVFAARADAVGAAQALRRVERRTA